MEEKEVNQVTMLTITQVAERLNVSTRSVWRMVKKNEIPQPVRYTRKMVRWRVADLEAMGI